MVPVCWLRAPPCPMLLAVGVWGLAEQETCRHLNFLLELTLASGVIGSIPSPGIPLTWDGEMGSGAVMMRPLWAQRWTAAIWTCGPRHVCSIRCPGLGSGISHELEYSAYGSWLLFSG